MKWPVLISNNMKLVRQLLTYSSLNVLVRRTLVFEILNSECSLGLVCCRVQGVKICSLNLFATINSTLQRSKLMWETVVSCLNHRISESVFILRRMCYCVTKTFNNETTTTTRCLYGQAPCYLADHLIPASDAAPRRGRLRSANRNCLTVPRCRLSTYGCRAFDYAGPTVWNSLPDELRNSTVLIVLNGSWKQLSLAATSVSSALEVISIMRCAT